MNRLILICKLIGFSVLISGGAATLANDQEAASELLSREIPISYAKGRFRSLAPFFADDVCIVSNVIEDKLCGRDIVFSALVGGMFSEDGLRNRVTNIVMTPKKIVFILNTPGRNSTERFDFAPHIDAFSLNASGKIYLVENFVGNKNVSITRAGPNG